jgi:hypothetical protein
MGFGNIHWAVKLMRDAAQGVMRLRAEAVAKVAQFDTAAGSGSAVPVVVFQSVDFGFHGLAYLPAVIKQLNLECPTVRHSFQR